MTHYVTPTFRAAAFTCPRCGAYAQQQWSALVAGGNQTDADRSLCTVCRGQSWWISRTLRVPATVIGPMPHESMPGEVTALYEEARDVAARSPRAAAALLRLALQQLFTELVPGEKNLDRAIGELVQKGLDPSIQRAMDVLRVVGNHSVHPGEIQLAGDTGLSEALFELTNQVVEQMIARPAKIEELFNMIPQGARDAIERRDEPPVTKP
ncbi:hypothetical protein BH10ACT8_BH10ACT8_11340 [soil metagenome]